MLELRPATNHVDVLIIGAGVSGIGAAWHLQDKQPGRSYAILEAREASGGTWDLFRYPGIRSDSDMYTLGYSFRPWDGAKTIADGDSIRTYIERTAAEVIRWLNRMCSSTPEAAAVSLMYWRIDAPSAMVFAPSQGRNE